MTILVILSWWVCFLSAQWCFSSVNVVDCYFFGYFLGFPIAHECDHSLELMLTYKLLCWAIILSSYTPSEACFWTRTLQWRWRRRWWLILQWHCTSIPLCCCWHPTRQNSSWIIILRWLVDSAIRPGSLYDGTALIAPDYGNTCGLW